MLHRVPEWPVRGARHRGLAWSRGAAGEVRAGPRPEGLGVGSEDLERRPGGWESVDSHSVLSTVSVVAQPCEEPSGEEGLPAETSGLGKRDLGDARRPAFRIVRALRSPYTRPDPAGTRSARREGGGSSQSLLGPGTCRCFAGLTRGIAHGVSIPREARQQLGALRRPGAWVGTAYILHPHPQLCRNEEEKQFPRRVVSFKYRNRRGVL